MVLDPCAHLPPLALTLGMVSHYSCHCLNVRVHGEVSSETLPSGFKRLHVDEDGTRQEPRVQFPTLILQLPRSRANPECFFLEWICGPILNVEGN